MRVIYTISKHAKERYAERIKAKDDKLDINKFVQEHDEKITNDINTMIDFGTVVYSGKNKHEGKTKDITVVIKDLWIILCDPASQNVITLYKVNLGLDDDFNKQYMAKMLEKLEATKKNKEEIEITVLEENNNYEQIIEDNNVMIADYKGYINNLEEINDSYSTIIKNNTVKVSIAEQDIRDVLNSLIGKKEF